MQKARLRLHRLILPLLLNVALGVLSHFLFASWVGWSAPGRDAYPDWLAYGVPFVQFMAMGFLLDRTVRVLAEGLRARKPASRGIPQLAVQLLSVLIYFCFAGASVGVVFGESVGAVLAASGIAGLAVGFAVRGLLSDVFSGIALHLDNSFSTGDWIDLTLRGQQIIGKLVDIQWRTVVIADRSQNLVFIPNSQFATATIVNRSQPGPATEYTTTINVGSQYDRARVVQVLENALACAVNAGSVLAEPRPYVRINGFDQNGGVAYRLYFCLDPNRVGPKLAQHQVLSYAIDFLKAANLRLQPSQQTEIRRPAVPGEDRFTEMSARLGVLADVPLLSVLSQSELAALAENSAVRFFRDGQAIMHAGAPGESMVVVVEGRLAVMIAGPDGPRKVATLWPGECAGEMSLLTGSPRSADVIAEGSTCLLEVPKAALTDILHANPLLVERIAAAIAKRTQSTLPGQTAKTGGSSEDDAGTLVAKMRKFFRLMA